MMWRNHSHRFPNALIDNAKVLSKQACDVALGKPNKPFVTLFVR